MLKHFTTKNTKNTKKTQEGERLIPVPVAEGFATLLSEAPLGVLGVLVVISSAFLGGDVDPQACGSTSHKSALRANRCANLARGEDEQ